MDCNQKSTKKCSALPSAECLRLIIQTRRKYKNEKTWRKDIRDDEISEDTEEKDSTHDEHDQDSISFDDDQDSTASQEVDLDDWIEIQKKKHERG